MLFPLGGFLIRAHRARDRAAQHWPLPMGPAARMTRYTKRNMECNTALGRFQNNISVLGSAVYRKALKRIRRLLQKGHRMKLSKKSGFKCIRSSPKDKTRMLKPTTGTGQGMVITFSDSKT